MKNTDLTSLMNGAIGRLVDTATRIALSDFSSVPALLRILKNQKIQASIRSRNEVRGLHVPPFIIASVVRACNLRCRGCYDRAKQDGLSPSASTGCGGQILPAELGVQDWRRIFGEARDLGVSFILLAGGEPLLRKDLLLECAGFPEIIFPVFTNGLLVDDAYTDFLVSARNVIPVVSMEGDESLTDARRGEGVYAKVGKSLVLLKKRHVLYGISITLSSENFDCVLSEEYLAPLVSGGSRLFFFVEYVPFDSATSALVVTEAQKARLGGLLGKLRLRFPAIFLDFPGDESAFGGCLASGRGFVHINASGGVESCPFAPYSDTAVSDRPLAEAISSPMLERIRGLQEELGHTGGCTLFENRVAVEALLADANPTG